MTLLWLIVWVLSGVPEVGHWNAWMIALGVCLLIDILGIREAT